MAEAPATADQALAQAKADLAKDGVQVVDTPVATSQPSQEQTAPTTDGIVAAPAQTNDRPAKGQHTWQSELANELKDIIKGFHELESKVPDLEKLLADLRANSAAVKDDVAKLLIDSKLQFFAGKLLGGGYDEQADFENHAQPLPQNTEAQDAQLGSAPSTTAASGGQSVPTTDGTPQAATAEPTADAAPASDTGSSDAGSVPAPATTDQADTAAPQAA